LYRAVISGLSLATASPMIVSYWATA